MQDNSSRKSNRDRTEATRTALLNAARILFVDKGFAETGTPEIVNEAAVTRGALYHHFKDKTDLFRAVYLAEAEAVAAAVLKGSEAPSSALEALMSGADAYFTAMKENGRARLMLIEAPAVLGSEEIEKIDRETGGEELLKGLELAQAHGALLGVPLAELAVQLSSAFDKAALAIAEGANEENHKKAIKAMLKGLFQ